MLNWVDLFIFFVLALYAYSGFRLGFIRNLIEFLGFVVSFLLGLKLFSLVAGILKETLSVPYNFAKPLGFLLVVLLTESIFFITAHFLYPKIPLPVQNSKANRIAGIFPALLKAVVVVSIVLTFIVALPFSGNLKKIVLDSYSGGFLVKKTNWLSASLENIFGGAIGDTLTFLTVKPESEEKVDLNFKTTSYTVDETSENNMLEMVNRERLKAGLGTLTMDFQIREVARKHSEDMFKRGYFSHINPDGLSPFDRMEAGGIEFTAAGENLALAPNLDLAHSGLMNSPGHRANILSPDFGRVGIGVIDGGPYGKMFTQNFAN